MKTIKNLKLFNYKLYFILILTLLLPTLYTTLRINFLGDLPSDYGVNIASQLSWINLIFESMQEALILPLFFIIGKSLYNKIELRNKIKTGLLTSFIVYLSVSILIFFNLDTLLKFMSQKEILIEKSMVYIRLELIAIIISILYKFISVLFISMNKIKDLIILLFFQLTLTILCDTFLVSSLSFSKNIGVNGIAISNMITNAILFIVGLVLLNKNGLNIFSRERLSFLWLKEWFKIGSLSGIESIVRNLAFFIMILKMINMVERQGDFWIANSFIWGWLLLPILALGNFIKKDVAENNDNFNKNLYTYFYITFIILAIWLITIPIWRIFLNKVMNVQEPQGVLNIIMVSLIFYIIFALNNVIDSIFYGLGRTDLMLKQSLIVNIGFYGIMFILFKFKYFIPTIDKVVLMFGFGILFDSLITFYLFIKLRKTNKLIQVMG